MPRTGEVKIRASKRPGGPRAFALRFYAYGTRRWVTLGHEPEWDERRAQAELEYVLSQVERGVWQPAVRTPVEAEQQPAPTFHTFASEWYGRIEPELALATRADYRWRLSNHLLPFFARLTLPEITVEQVDRYRAAKLREGTLAPVSINKTLTLLGQVLEQAVEYGHLERNPATGKRRRLRVSSPEKAYLDQAVQIEALLDAAAQLDRDARVDRRHIPRRAILSTLTLAGLRISELLGLRWRHVDLAAGRIRIGDSKTDAGHRSIDVLPALRDHLLDWRAAAPSTAREARVFPSATGGRLSPENVRTRVLSPAVELASARLEADGYAPLPEGLTPHALRRTFASVLVELGENPRYVMAQLGHTDPAFTLRLYARSMSRDAGAQEALRTLVGSRSGDSSPVPIEPIPFRVGPDSPLCGRRLAS
jgi:integrase